MEFKRIFRVSKLANEAQAKPEAGVESAPGSSHGYTYKYPHPAVTVDGVIFGFDGESLQVLLIERGLEPYKGMWALPGGFMHIDESAEEAVARELLEETNLTDLRMAQFHTYSQVGRDPRERVVTIAYLALVRKDECNPKGGDDARRAVWFNVDFLPPMAFDHQEIISDARSYLSEVIRIRPVVFSLLNEVFTLPELQKVYELINCRQYDRRNFQRKALQSSLLKPLDDEPAGGTRGRRYSLSVNLDEQLSDAPSSDDDSNDDKSSGIRDIFSF